MKIRITILILLFLAAGFVWAEGPKPFLKKGDVKQFIKTFPMLQKDFEALGAKYTAASGQLTIPETLKASSDFRNILKKHGWDEHFFQKATTILLGYSALVYHVEVTKMDPKFAENMKRIQSNPAMSEEMKKQVIEKMKAAMGIVKSQGQALKDNLNKADLDLIRPAIDQLKNILEPDKKK